MLNMPSFCLGGCDDCHAKQNFLGLFQTYISPIYYQNISDHISVENPDPPTQLKEVYIVLYCGLFDFWHLLGLFPQFSGILNFECFPNIVASRLPKTPTLVPIVTVQAFFPYLDPSLPTNVFVER